MPLTIPFKTRREGDHRFQDPNAMTLGEHLEDLRKRVVLSLLGLAPILVVGLIVGIPLLEALIVPVRAELRAQGLPAVLQATGPLETFLSYVRISIVLAILGGSPWVLYQLWRFVAPGLYEAERRFVYVLIPMSAVLSLLGVLFLYFVIWPVVLAFFINFGAGIGRETSPLVQTDAVVVFPEVPVLKGDPANPEPGQEWVNLVLMQRRICVGVAGGEPQILGTELTRGSGIVQQYRVSEYVKLLLSLAMAFALGFQTPVVVLLLGWAGLVNRATLAKYRKHAMMGAAVVSAVLTPADPLSMVLLAVPLYLLYELGAILLVVLPARRIAGERLDGRAEATDEQS